VQSAEWCRTSFVVWPTDDERRAITDALGQASSSSEASLVWDLEASDTQPADEQLERLHNFLVRHREHLMAMARPGAMAVTIGWTPRSPQDGLAITPGLARLLADLGIPLKLDTYTG
jgi:hypothetical protein